MQQSLMIQRLSHRHEALANLLVLNPHLTLREISQRIGYTQAHLSRIINSDAFRRLLAERSERIAAEVCRSIPERLTDLATLAIDKMTEQLEKTENPDFILDAFDQALSKLGYSGKQPAAQPAVNVQQTFVLSREELHTARAEIISANSEEPENALPTGQSLPVYDQAG